MQSCKIFFYATKIIQYFVKKTWVVQKAIEIVQDFYTFNLILFSLSLPINIILWTRHISYLNLKILLFDQVKSAKYMTSEYGIINLNLQLIKL